MSDLFSGPAETIQGSAEFSPCRDLRHRLDRWWADGPRALICGCNPSKAGWPESDPTVHRIVDLCRALDLPGFTLVNWCPYIATDPEDMRNWRARMRRDHPVGLHRINADNLNMILMLSRTAAVRIAAWGRLLPFTPTETLLALSANGRHRTYAFGRTKDGSPKHPMARGKHRIVPGTPLIEWSGA